MFQVFRNITLCFVRVLLLTVVTVWESVSSVCIVCSKIKFTSVSFSLCVSAQCTVLNYFCMIYIYFGAIYVFYYLGSHFLSAPLTLFNVSFHVILKGLESYFQFVVYLCKRCTLSTILSFDIIICVAVLSFTSFEPRFLHNSSYSSVTTTRYNSRFV